MPADPPQPYVTETVTPKRDIFPYVMGALIAFLVVGFGVIVFVLGGPGNNPVAPVPTPITNAPAGVPTSQSDVIPNPQITNGAGSSNETLSSPGVSPVATVQPTVPAGSTDQDVPRISMDEFKALYDDPAKRPVIIDVRAASGYDAGHIKGAINFPEEQIATLVSQLPKDKLVVAYCS